MLREPSAPTRKMKRPLLTSGLFRPLIGVCKPKKGFSLTICREWSLVKSDFSERHAKPLLCRSWNCEHCAPIRQRQLVAQARSGRPNRFLTLTINPEVGESPDDRRAILARALHIVIQRARREHPNSEIEYFAVVEATKRGEPHIHVLLRSPFLPQPQISAWMDELAASPIVHIESIDSEGKAAAYVAKYAGKEPVRFGSFKRYWASRGYAIPDPDDDYEPAPKGSPWYVDMRPLPEILKEWTMDGYVCRQDEKGWMVGFPAPPGSPSARQAPPRIEAKP